MAFELTLDAESKTSEVKYPAKKAKVAGSARKAKRALRNRRASVGGRQPSHREFDASSSARQFSTIIE